MESNHNELIEERYKEMTKPSKLFLFFRYTLPIFFGVRVGLNPYKQKESKK